LQFLTYPSGHVVRYYYDAAGRPTGIAFALAAGGTESSILNTTTYLPFGPLAQMDLINGLSDIRAYDLSGVIKDITVQPTAGGTPILRRYMPMADGVNLTQFDDLQDNARDQWFTYDAAGRLTQAELTLPTKGYGKLKWSYDKVGNRLTEVEEFGTVVTNSYSYPTTANRITDVKQGTTTVRSFLYDAAGNLTKDTKGTVATDYVYNNRNRLSQAKIGTTIKGNYVYDGFERLAIREVLNTTPSGKTHFLYNEENDVIAETSAATGASFREYIWLPGEGVGGGGKPIAVIDAANTATPKTYWISTDHLDRPVIMTDSTRAIVWRAEYRPFGEVISLSGPAATDANFGTQRFPGQWFQLETGLAYNWHRHYDASLGKYTQVDPLGLDALVGNGPLPFGYGRQSPVAITDRDGRFWWILGGAAAGIALGLIADYLEDPDCFSVTNSLFGMGIDGAAGAAAGDGFDRQPYPRKGVGGPSGSGGTSRLSQGLSKAFPGRGPRIPTPWIGQPGRGTRVVGRVLGRYAPWLGVINAGYDGYRIVRILSN
jgi:RHS repeat-associated protein